MFQEIFGSEVLAGLKSNVINIGNKPFNRLVSRSSWCGSEDGIEMHECVYQKATEVTEELEVDGRYLKTMF